MVTHALECTTGEIDFAADDTRDPATVSEAEFARLLYRNSQTKIVNSNSTVISRLRSIPHDDTKNYMIAIDIFH